jgi:hypothetical protein
MALANAALPDDSPYKITRADVALLRKWNTYANTYYAAELTVEESVQWNRLIAKLAALLPPR